MKRLEQIYLENKQGLFSVALSITRNAAEAEDAIHNAIIRLAKKDIDEIGGLKAYVYASVRNAALDILRKRKRLAETSDDIFDESRAVTRHTPEKELEKQERHFLLRKMVEQLPDKQRQTVVMKIYSGLTFQEIADILEEPLSTVSSRYERCLKSLKSHVETFV